MSYIDGVVVAVPTSRKEEYISYCKAVGKIFRRHGALAVVDTWGVEVPAGKQTDLIRAVQATPDETVSFGWVIWADKEAHDAGWGGVMQDSEMSALQMPYDGKRMIFGGFESINEA